MTTSNIAPANNPSELTAENREATISYLRDEVGFPVDTLGATFELEGVTFVVAGPDTAFALDGSASHSYEGQELNNDIDADTRLENVIKACLAYHLNYRSLLMSVHTAFMVFKPEALTYGEEDTTAILDLIEKFGGEEALMEMRLMAAIGAL